MTPPNEPACLGAERDRACALRATASPGLHAPGGALILTPRGAKTGRRTLRPGTARDRTAGLTDPGGLLLNSSVVQLVSCEWGQHDGFDRRRAPGARGRAGRAEHRPVARAVAVRGLDGRARGRPSHDALPDLRGRVRVGATAGRRPVHRVL